MVVDRVHTESDDLAITPLELRHQPRHIAEFGCADRREILRMGEQDRPPIADPVVETDVSLGRFGAEVRDFRIYSQRHDASPSFDSPCESWSGTWPAVDIPNRRRRHGAAFPASPV